MIIGTPKIRSYRVLVKFRKLLLQDPVLALAVVLLCRLTVSCST